jgi:ribosomal protein S18 acetylase RimI-like enzyme
LNRQKNDLPIQLSLRPVPDWETYNRFGEIAPSWQNQAACINRDLKNLRIVEAFHKTHTIGYVIFQSDLGRIDQLAVDPDYRNQGVGRNLLRAVKEMSYKKALTVLNVEDGSSADCFLKKCGFKVGFQQWEMVRKL